MNARVAERAIFATGADVYRTNKPEAEGRARAMYEPEGITQWPAALILPLVVSVHEQIPYHISPMKQPSSDPPCKSPPPDRTSDPPSERSDPPHKTSKKQSNQSAERAVG
jgi:hypothetical protein